MLVIAMLEAMVQLKKTKIITSMPALTSSTTKNAFTKLNNNYILIILRKRLLIMIENPSIHQVLSIHYTCMWCQAASIPVIHLIFHWQDKYNLNTTFQKNIKLTLLELLSTGMYKVWRPTHVDLYDYITMNIQHSRLPLSWVPKALSSMTLPMCTTPKYQTYLNIPSNQKFNFLSFYISFYDHTIEFI